MKEINKVVMMGVTDEGIDKVEEMRVKCKLKTRGDVFNVSLSLLDWAVRVMEGGKSVASVNHDEGSFSELILPGLSNVKAKVKKKRKS